MSSIRQIHREVLILGAGLAGMATALHLAQRGVACTLLETRKHLGGRAASTTDPRSSEEIDNCQHVALGCCVQYMDFLQRVGADQYMRWTSDQHWIHAPAPGVATVTRISNAALPAPFQGLPALLGAEFLDLPAKLAAIQLGARAVLADRSHLAHLTFTQWLQQVGIESDLLVDRLLAPIIISACNCLPSQCSAEAALHVLQDAIFHTPAASTIGVSSVPLSQLYAKVPEMLRQAGSEIYTGAGVEWFNEHVIALTDGRLFTADQVVCALSFERACAAAAPDLRFADDRFEAMNHLQHGPILGVHLKFAEPICPYPHAVLVDRPTQWVFRKDEDGRHLHCVISAATEWMDWSEPQIVQHVCADLGSCFGCATTPVPTWARAIKERRATFIPSPQSYAHRPSSRPLHPGGIILAGDYVQTGWPATMESAVRSGAIAAAATLGLPPSTFLVPDLHPPGLLTFLPSGRPHSLAE